MFVGQRRSLVPPPKSATRVIQIGPDRLAKDNGPGGEGEDKTETGTR